MGQFTPETFADWIGFLLVVAVALWGGWKMLTHYLDNAPFMDEEPPRYQVNPSNAANIIAGMTALRTPLPQHKNQTPPDEGWDGISNDWDQILAWHGVFPEDRADINRGTKLP